MNKRNSQNIILVTGDRGKILVRGVGINKALAKTYGEYYLGNIHSSQEIDGKTALAYAIFNTKILDLDADCVI